MSRLGVSYNGYTSSDLPELMTLIGTDLSEPYHLQTVGLRDPRQRSE